MEYLFNFIYLVPRWTAKYRIYYVEGGVYWAVASSTSKAQYYDSDAEDFYFTKEGKKWVSTPTIESDMMKDLINMLIDFKVQTGWKEKY